METADYLYRAGGVPSISHSRRARCNVIMCSRVIQLAERECGGCPPRRRCNVVDSANVPQDHKGSGASLWIVIRGSWRYGGRAGMGILRELKDSKRAWCSLYCIRVGDGMLPGRGFKMDH